jgi:hypothetical protein
MHVADAFARVNEQLHLLTRSTTCQLLNFRQARHVSSLLHYPSAFRQAETQFPDLNQVRLCTLAANMIGWLDTVD